MVAKQRSDDPWKKEPIIGSIRLYWLAEPILLIASASVIIYFLSYGYYQGFFEKLSIPYKGLELPITFYLSVGYWTATLFGLFISSILFAYVVWVRVNIRKAKNFYEVSFFSAIGLVISLILDYLLPIQHNVEVVNIMFLWFFLLGLIGIITLKAKNKKISAIGATFRAHALTYFGGLIILPLLISVLIMAPHICGSHSASKLIEGQPGSLSVTFELKDENSSVSNRTLILVMFHNGIYYAVEKANPAPDTASLYIIPCENVKSVAIRTIDDGTDDTHQHLAGISKELTNWTNSLHLPSFEKDGVT